MDDFDVFIMSLFLSGVINVLLRELKEMKRKKKDLSEKEIKSLTQPQKKVEGKSYIPASWSITDTTTENLLLTKKPITGDL